MTSPHRGQRNPSRYIASTISPCPIRYPNRARGRRYGVADMHSVPPTRTASFSPAAIDRAPSVNAFNDEAHALLTVNAGTESGTPARCETWRAVLGPPPAWRACPKIVSSIAAGGSPERSIAARAATSPRSAADIDAKAPPNFPIGVRTAERTKTGLTEITLASEDRCHLTRGNRTVTVVPRSSSLAMSTFPLWASTIQRTIERPSPDPPV